MENWINQLLALNFVSIILFGIIALSLVQGFNRGATSSAKHLFYLLLEGLLTIVALFLSWKLANMISPMVQSWLVGLNMKIPSEELGLFQQLYFTLVTGIRDFTLLRFGILFIICFVLLKHTAYLAVVSIYQRHAKSKKEDPKGLQIQSSYWSGALGGLIGIILGIGRAILLVAILFIYVTLFPQAPFTGYIQASDAYQKGADHIIEPITGDFFDNQFPVFTRAVEDEFNKILQRKYEVIDYNIPENIADAAKEITLNLDTDEEKARALYQWVGTRVQYDWEKVRLYEEENRWMEQTPEDTFATRYGVCIDYSRLYSVMARAVELEVKVITGLGYDGQGGYGPHAWNEVYLSEQNKWVPLDTTWVSSGRDWFNPPNFNESHVKDA
jgi:hypothetical protein